MNLDGFKLIDGDLYRRSDKEWEILDKQLYLKPSRMVRIEGKLIWANNIIESLIEADWKEYDDNLKLKLKK